MNKAYLHRNRIIFFLAVACAGLACLVPRGGSAAAKAAAQQQQTQAAGHLVIVRSANLGSIVVGLSIDGKEIAKLNFGGRYDAALTAGPHVLSAVPIPNREHAQPSETRVTVQPGQTYRFTAKQSDVSIVLK